MKGQPAARSRRRAVRLECLEDRLAPAVAGDLYVVGTTLVYNGNFADNNVTISGTDSAFHIADSAGTIQSTVPGFSSGTSITGAIPSYIQSIAINGQNGTDVISVSTAALTTTRNVILTGTTLNLYGGVTARNVTLTASVVNLDGGTIGTTGAGPVAGSAVINGTVIDSSSSSPTIDTDSVLDGNITLNGTVSGVDSLVLDAGTTGNVTITGAVNLSGGSSLTVTDANNVNLHQVVTGSLGASITAQNAVNLNGSLITGGDVAILANQDGTGPEGFTQVAGNIITTSTVGTLTSPTVEIVVNAPVGGSGAGTGNATINDIVTGADAVVSIITQSSASTGGAIVDGNGQGALNVNIPNAAGTLSLQSGPGGIDLDTSVSNVSVNEATTGVDQAVTLRNSGLALEVAGATTGGDISVSNNLALDAVGISTPGNITLTTTNGASVTAVSVNSSGAAGTLTINSAGTIESGPIGAANIVLSAAAGIGTGGAVLIDPTVAATTLTASTTSGGIAADSLVPLTIDQATAGAGAINLSTITGDINVNGNVSTLGAAVTLQTLAGGSILVNSGVISSDTGAVTLEPFDNFTLSAPATVTTGGDITISPTFATTEDISGTIAASGSVTVNGGTATLLTVGGTIAAGVDTGTSLVLDAQTLLLGGTITAGSGTTTISTNSLGGATTLLMNGQLLTGGATTIGSSGLLGPISMTLSGTIKNTAGGVTINESLVGATVITMSGSTTSAGAVTIGDNAGLDTLLLTTTGPITGASVAITGNALGANTFSIGGPVTATTVGAGNLTITGGDTTDSIVVSGQLNTGSNLLADAAEINTGSGTTNLVITPSLASQIAFTSSGTNTLQINTALGNIFAAAAPFPSASPIVFTTASGYQQWTETSGSWTVTPTVP